MTLDELALDDLRPLVGETFAVDRGDDTVTPLILVSVTDLVETGRAPVQAGRRHAFSAVFRGPGGPGYLRQRTYPVAQARLGTLDIFLVPIGPNAEGMQYEAIFS
jgi:Domain of unknown function (DUF6916)